jgi:hypothetical protein
VELVFLKGSISHSLLSSYAAIGPRYPLLAGRPFGIAILRRVALDY